MHGRSFFCQSSVDLLTIFYSEVLCAWFYISLLSNNLVAVEARVQTLLVAMLRPSAAPGQGQGSTGGNNNSNSNNNYSSSSSGYGRGTSSSLLSSAHTQTHTHSSAGAIKTLQQQKQQQYKNYQSISTEEALP